MTAESKSLLSHQFTRSVVVGMGLAALLTSCGKKEEIKAEQPELIEVPVTHVVKQTLNRMDQLPGEIRAYQDVAVYPKVPGFIKWIGVDRGSDVKKGERMVQLIAPELRAQKNEEVSKAESTAGQIQEAKAKVASAKASLLEVKSQLAGDTDTYTRLKEASLVPGVVAPNDVVVLSEKVNADKEKVNAWEENVHASENQVTALQDSLKAAKHAANSSRDIEDYLTVTAPFDGYVTERNMHVGSFVGPRGQGAYPPIVNVQQLDLLRIITPVPEIDVSGVEPGAQVQFTVSTHPGEKFTGTVARIGDYLEKKTRTMPVELNYPNANRRILPGMFCEVLWPTRRQHPTLFVPGSAVVSTSTLATFVNRINSNGEIEWVNVKRGEMMGDMIEVFGDLNEGDVIAVKGDDSLKPETKVRAVANTTKVN